MVEQLREEVTGQGVRITRADGRLLSEDMWAQIRNRTSIIDFDTLGACFPFEYEFLVEPEHVYVVFEPRDVEHHGGPLALKKSFEEVLSDLVPAMKVGTLETRKSFWVNLELVE